jgi:hypothetical protein
MITENHVGGLLVIGPLWVTNSQQETQRLCRFSWSRQSGGKCGFSEPPLQQSGLDGHATLTSVHRRFNPKLPRQGCCELHTLKFIAEGQNTLSGGKSGTGKSPIGKTASYEATLHGLHVRLLKANGVYPHCALRSGAE